MPTKHSPCVFPGREGSVSSDGVPGSLLCGGGEGRPGRWRSGWAPNPGPAESFILNLGKGQDRRPGDGGGAPKIAGHSDPCLREGREQGQLARERTSRGCQPLALDSVRCQEEASRPNLIREKEASAAWLPLFPVACREAAGLDQSGWGGGAGGRAEA